MRNPHAATSVLIELQVEGFHRWKDAIEPVDFLRTRHRHTFVIRMAFAVEHNDRDKEIFILRDQVREWIDKNYGSPAEFDGMSCESIAHVLLDEGGHGCKWVEVWEENTGGARVDAV